MRIKTSLWGAALIICLIVYSFFAIQPEAGPEFAVSVDLGRPLAIEWPCEVSIVGVSGEKGLRIAPKVGRGWRGEAAGQASYRFFIPEEGRYRIWAYCLWYDECANAVFARIDDQDKAIIGNDPIYQQWHWVRGFDIDLNRGTHNLVLSNHSDHIALQTVVFSRSTAAGTQPTGLIFSDIFYDGFDGCDQGNFASWRQISGTWRVENPDSATCLIENALIGQSQNKALLIYPNRQWRDYSLDVSIRVVSCDLPQGAVAIAFGLVDEDEYYQLKIRPSPGGRRATITVSDRQATVLAQFESAFLINEWQQIQVALKKAAIEIALADADPVKIEITQPITGGIGFLLEGNVTAHFDNVHVRTTAYNGNQEP